MLVPGLLIRQQLNVMGFFLGAENMKVDVELDVVSSHAHKKVNIFMSSPSNNASRFRKVAITIIAFARPTLLG